MGASSVDGTFKVQDFQCAWKRNTVANAIAIKMGNVTIVIKNNQIFMNGSTVTDIPEDIGTLAGSMASKRGVTLLSSDKCNRINVNVWRTHKKPDYFHNIAVGMTNPEGAGMCGKRPPHQYVANSDALFTADQLADLCSHCAVVSNRIPEICKPGGLPNPGVTADVPDTTGQEACASANPPIALSVAQAKCQSVGDAAMVEACIIDYCSSDGDDAVTENAKDEASNEPADAKAPVCWVVKRGYFVREGHSLRAGGCKATLEEAKTACLASSNCRAITTQSNICGGKYRVINGGPTFKFFKKWKRYKLRSWKLDPTCTETNAPTKAPTKAPSKTPTKAPTAPRRPATKKGKGKGRGK